MKADIRHCSICLLNSMLMEMELFQASEELQKKEFHDFLKKLTDHEDLTPVELQDPYIRRLHELAGYDFYQEQREQDQNAADQAFIVQHYGFLLQTAACRLFFYGPSIARDFHSGKSACNFGGQVCAAFVLFRLLFCIQKR